MRPIHLGSSILMADRACGAILRNEPISCLIIRRFIWANPTTMAPELARTATSRRYIAALSHSYEMASNGWEAGGQIGCNAQWGMAVVGVEGDWQWSNTSTAADAAFAAFPNAGNPLFTDAAHSEHVDVTQRWFATGRVRAGFTPWERVLVYGTGGVAWANYTSNTSVIFAALA